METSLFELIDDYKSLLDKKDALAEETKKTNADIKASIENITEKMIDEDVPSVTRKGFKYTLTPKQKFNKIGDARLAEEGIDFFETLTEAGLGDLIKMTVPSNSLSAACKAAYEENGDELPDDLKKIVEPFEWMDITKRKEAVK